MIFLLHFNHDYNESTEAHATRAAAVESVGIAFGIDTETTGHDTAEFWEAVDSHYAAGDWKGFTFQTLDPATLKIADAPRPDAFDLDNLPESYGFRVDSFRAFQLICKNPLIESLRIMANRNDPPQWVLWDPQDPAEGFMLAGNIPGDLRKEFAEHARAHFDPPTKSA
jgi:hypothetical protein